MQLVKLKMKSAMKLGSTVFPEGKVFYIDAYTGKGGQRTFGLYDEDGVPIDTTREGYIFGCPLWNNAERIS